MKLKGVKLMSSATLTLLGLYQYGLGQNVYMFEKLTLPEGIDKTLVVDNILHECGDYELLYPDLEFMCSAVDMFAKKWQRTFEKWLAVLSEEYKPLANYDRIEEWSDSMSTSTSEFASTSTTDSSISSEAISAFNSSQMRPNTSASEDVRNYGEQRNDKLDNSLSRHDGRIWGNIGVMTTQSILKEEMQVDKINIYDEIMIIFAREFLIPFSY